MIADTYRVERACGHSESKWITGAYQADVEWKLKTLQGRNCGECAQAAKQPGSNLESKPISRPMAGCRRYTRDQGCPDHGELCGPDYR